MHLPQLQTVLATSATLTNVITNSKTVAKGEIMDFAVPKCIDSDGNQRCSEPFLVAKDKCYNLEWNTDGLLSHTTVEVRDAGSDELVFYRDTDGEWTAEKNELVYVDFMPKIWGTGNDTVKYKVKTCPKEK